MIVGADEGIRGLGSLRGIVVGGGDGVLKVMVGANEGIRELGSLRGIVVGGGDGVMVGGTVVGDTVATDGAREFVMGGEGIADGRAEEREELGVAVGILVGDVVGRLVGGSDGIEIFTISNM